VTNEVTNDN